MLFQLRRVTKNFGAQKVFRHLDFEIERATFSILTGASGSGKTTFFRMLSGVERPSEGQIFFLGRELSQLSPTHLKQIGFIFQHPRGLADRTVFENIALPLKIDGISKSEIEKRVFYWLEQMGLSLKATSLFRELSGGEKQKTEFARALIRKPRLILADEPTAHLDAIQSDHLMDILWDHYKQGATVFISTHYPPTFDHPEILRYKLSKFKIFPASNDTESDDIGVDTGGVIQ